MSLDSFIDNAARFRYMRTSDGALAYNLARINFCIKVVSMALIDNKEAKELRLQNASGTLLSDRAYNAIIGFTLLCGLIVNAVMAVSMPISMLEAVMSNYIAFIVAFLVVAIGSVFVIHRSDNPVISFVGFLVLSVAFGVLVSFVVSAYTAASVQRAFIMTSAVTGLMILAAVVFPGVFLSLGRALFVALVGVIIVEVLTMLVFGIHPAAFDWIFVGIFSLYIAYDWQRAQMYPHTADNAVDSAADLYVDIVNLFIRILSIIGVARD